jgi:hypothetical protein
MKKIAADKWKHFYAGIVMGIVILAFLLFLLEDQLILCVIISFAIVIAVSYGFELFSKVTGMGHHDVIDAVASIVGGILGMGLTLAIHILF